jgi:hypothetical protein
MFLFAEEIIHVIVFLLNLLLFLPFFVTFVAKSIGFCKKPKGENLSFNMAERTFNSLSIFNVQRYLLRKGHLSLQKWNVSSRVSPICTVGAGPSFPLPDVGKLNNDPRPSGRKKRSPNPKQKRKSKRKQRRVKRSFFGA